jgi:hypothetical protein
MALLPINLPIYLKLKLIRKDEFILKYLIEIEDK